MVVPVFGNAATLAPLLDRVQAAFADAGRSAEVIFVDDGSPDDSWVEIERLAQQGDRVRGLRLAANQGQGVAVSTAFERARGSVLATIDADLDSFPEDLLALVEAAEEHGFAMGVRAGHRPAARALASRVFNARIRSLGYRFHDIGSGSLAVRAELGTQLAGLGDERRTIRYKLALYRLAGGVVERPTRSVLTRGSHYRWRDLAAIWAEVEVEVVGARTGEVVRSLLRLPRPTSPDPEVVGDTAVAVDPGAR